ncbi:MAG: DUF1732 domain-containing protein [bacterium]|nr:DUF1732 domain-containing protein [bacterium]
MIISMTGFSEETFTNQDLTITCKIKTVNHKYSDFEIILPVTDYEIESEILNSAKQSISRGKVIISLEIEKGSTIKSFSLDLNLLKKVSQVLKEARNFLGEDFNAIKISELFNFTGIIKSEYIKDHDFKEKLLKLFNTTLNKLIENRKAEGKALEKDLKERIRLIKDGLKIIKANKNNHTKKMLQTFSSKLKEFDQNISELTHQVIDFELALISEKADINEEIVRSEYHISNFLREINLKEASSGRKLEFITQELLREINTIGSKSSDIEIRNGVIIVKEEIEKIRQQVRNIE